MEFNKCIRCGSFFASNNKVCPNCQAKDEVDKSTIRSFLANNDIPQNVESLAFQSGVSVKNVNRYLQSKEFSDLRKTFNNISL